MRTKSSRPFSILFFFAFGPSLVTSCPPPSLCSPSASCPSGTVDRHSILSAMLVSTIVSALSLFAVASAQSTGTSASASATQSVVASAAPGTNGYDYIGCYNETTGIAGTSGARAITGGKMDTGDNTTVAECLQYCGQNSYQYAGLEYSKEYVTTERVKKARRYTDSEFTGAGVVATSLLCRISCPSRTARLPVWATTVSSVVVSLRFPSTTLRARRLALTTPLLRPKVLQLRSLLRAGPTSLVQVSWL